MIIYDVLARMCVEDEMKENIGLRPKQKKLHFQSTAKMDGLPISVKKCPSRCVGKKGQKERMKELLWFRFQG